MKKEIAATIKKLRTEKGITQQDAAKALNMTRQRFSRIENGIADISYDVILQISNLFKVDIKDILSVKESSAPMYRKTDDSVSDFSAIEEIINFFYANKSLYDKINSENDQQ